MSCQTCEDKIFRDKNDGRWYMRIENGNWNEYIDGFDYTDIQINFCYECGKSYKK